MGEHTPRALHAHPHDAVDLAHVSAMHGAERVGPPHGVLGVDRPCHPEENVLRVDGSILGTAGFLAFLGKRVFDFAEERSERDRHSGLFADLAYRRMAVGLVELQLAFRPAPIVVFWPVHDAHFKRIEVGQSGCRGRLPPVVRELHPSLKISIAAIQHRACSFYDFHLTTHPSIMPHRLHDYVVSRL